MVQFLSIISFSWISSIFVGFFKSSRFLCHPVYGVMNMVAYSLVLMSVFVDFSTFYRSLVSRVRRKRTNREKLCHSIRRVEKYSPPESLKLDCNYFHPLAANRCTKLGKPRNTDSVSPCFQGDLTHAYNCVSVSQGHLHSQRDAPFTGFNVNRTISNRTTTSQITVYCSVSNPSHHKPHDDTISATYKTYTGCCINL